MFKKITLLFVFFVLFAGISWAADGRFTLVIDPGHGGHDAGAVGAISKEKDINLNVALAFGRYVEQNLPDVNVVYTRKRDIFIPLHQRADIANKAKADLFISVHTNSVASGRYVKGFQVYTLGMHRAKDNLDVAMRENSVISMETGYQQTYQGFDPNSSESYIMFEFMQNANMEKSVELARLIQNSVCSIAGRVDKGVHQAGFLVLRESYMPGCLIELGFITAADEEEYLNSSGGIDSMARGIYNAFVQYKNMYDTHIVVPYRPAENRKITVDRVIPTPPADRPRPVPPPSNPSGRSRSVPPASNSSDRSRSVPSASNSTDRHRPEPHLSKVQAAKKRIADAIRELIPRNDNQSETPKSMPLFKVQVLAANRSLRPGSPQFRGRTDIECMQEGNWYKYTIGSSTNYNEIARLRERLLRDFPQAFVIAYKDGVRMDVNQAIEEFLKNKRKK
ncbi:MAG: N-acetylmuramoyl-L-alanine amidase family protein [Prevotella fusca]|uniref:N-acetylmuramoyl-L-alanine amidase family protein n=1 Tax=Prevotella fusca TaxID=589436 RepID=UPI003F9ED403